MSLRIVYMGTPEIARVCLERIYQLSLIHISEPTRH